MDNSGRMDDGEQPRRSPYGPATPLASLTPNASPPAHAPSASAPPASAPPPGRRPFWTPTVVVVAVIALGVAVVIAAGLASALGVGASRYEAAPPIPSYVDAPVNTQPDAPEGAKPGSIAGFAAPRGGAVSETFTLEQAVAASQQISDLSVQTAGPINDPDIAPGTTSFPVYPVGCYNVEGTQVDAEVWFRVDDVPAAIERVSAVWVAAGYTLDPTSSEGRIGYIGPVSGPIDVVSIENKSGVVKLRVMSVCTPGTAY